MNDHLLYLYSTIAQLAAVVAIPFVITVGADARAWVQPEFSTPVRIIQGVWHLITIAAIGGALVLSIVCLAANYSTGVMMNWAIVCLIIAYSSTVVGIVVRYILTAFVPRTVGSKFVDADLT